MALGTIDLGRNTRCCGRHLFARHYQSFI